MIRIFTQQKKTLLCKKKVSFFAKWVHEALHDRLDGRDLAFSVAALAQSKCIRIWQLLKATTPLRSLQVLNKSSHLYQFQHVFYTGIDFSLGYFVLL